MTTHMVPSGITKVSHPVYLLSMVHLMHAKVLSNLKVTIFQSNVLRVCTSVFFINPRRACAARVTVVVSCVCVCLSAHALLAVHAIKSITKDTIVLSVRFAAILKWNFSLNCLIRKIEHFLLTLAGAVGHL